MDLWKRIISEEEGQAMVEYIILVVLVVLTTAVVMVKFPDTMADYYFRLTTIVGMPIGLL